jgi:hypothetical protein
MLETNVIKEHLSKTFCYKCGTSLEDAKITTISEVPVAMVAHAKCQNCQAESMVTITVSGGGAIPMLSDLNGEELKRFLGAKSITYDELLDLHTLLKKKPICELMHIKEKHLEKKQKLYAGKENSLS